MKKITDYINKYHLHSLISDVKVKNIMTAPVITLTESEKISEARAVMREGRFSGIPIVDENGKLKGIMSIEDIIISLEQGTLERPIREQMTDKVVSVREDDLIHCLIEIFSEHTYGRLPVVNDEGEVMGIITKGDMGIGLSLHLLHRIETLYEHNQRRQALLAMDMEDKGLDFDVKKRYFFYSIEGTDIEKAGEGSLIFKSFVKGHPLSEKVVKKASIAVYEAEVNVVIHAEGEGNIRAYVTDDTLFVFVTDNGPGISDIEQAMEEGYTTASEEARQCGFGAGMGFSNMSRYSDKLIVLSDTHGTKVEMMFHLDGDSAGGELDESKAGGITDECA